MNVISDAYDDLIERLRGLGQGGLVRVAQRAGVSPRTLEYMTSREAGKRPRIDTILRVSAALDNDVHDHLPSAGGVTPPTAVGCPDVAA